jgi:hypothetical protein
VRGQSKDLKHSPVPNATAAMGESLAPKHALSVTTTASPRVQPQQDVGTSGSFLNVSIQGKRPWKKALKNNSQFIEITASSDDGFFLPVTNTLTLQLFPKLYTERRFGYLGNVYSRPREGSEWSKVSELELEGSQVERCFDATEH